MTTDITIKSEISPLAELEVDRQFAATDLIRTLLLFHKASVNPDRHVYLSYQVFNRCIEAYNAILELMQICQEEEGLHWDLIVLYMRAISILERILLSFDSDNWPDISRDYFPREGDVIGCLAFIDTWVQDRHRLIKALQDLRSQQFLFPNDSIPQEIRTQLNETKTLVAQEYADYRSRDDSATIAAILAFFQTFSDDENLPMDHAITETEERKRTVIAARDQISTISHKLRVPFATDAVSEIFVKSLMLLSIPFSLLSTNNQSLNDSTKRHLVRGDVWEAVKKYSQEIANLVESTRTPDINKLKTDYDNLRRLLLSAQQLIDTVTEMLELIKMSTRIRPPYHKRTVALVKILRFLDEESTRTQVGPMQRHALKGVLQRSIQILEGTETAMANTTAILLSDSEYQEHGAVFRAHLARVETCSQTLGLSGQWSTKEAEFNEAVAVDEQFFNQLREQMPA